MEDLAPLRTRLAREARARQALEEMLGARSSKLSRANRSLAEASASLSRQREYAEAIVSTVPSGLLVVGTDATVVSANQRMKDLLPHVETWAGEPIAKVLPRAVTRMVQAVIDGDTSAIEVEVMDPAGPKWERAFRLGVHPMPPDRAGGRRLLVSLDDITARKRAEEQLLQAQKLESIGQLAAGIAHEINTPIQFVADNMSFLAKAMEDLGPALESLARLAEPLDLTLPAPEELRYLVREIPAAISESLAGVERVSEIVLAMKDLSHPGSKTKQPVDVNHAVETAVVVSRNAWKYVADIELDLSDALPPVPGLPGELSQVFLNIIVNAAQAIEEMRRSSRGTISIRTRCDGGWAEVRVQDDGPGMAPAVCERVFDPFFTTKAIGKGTGQGLALAHSIITVEHKGTLRCESEPGRGATFVVRLPLSQEDE